MFIVYFPAWVGSLPGFCPYPRVRCGPRVLRLIFVSVFSSLLLLIGGPGEQTKIHLPCLLRPAVRVCSVCVLFLLYLCVPLVSDTDKKRIMMWSHKGKVFFEQEDEEERR